MCKKLKLDHTTNWYMLKLDLTSKMRLWNFERQTDHLVSTRRSDLVLINKNKNFLKRGSQSANKNEKKKREVLEPCPRIENTVNGKMTVIPIVFGTLGTVAQRIRKGIGTVGNWRKNQYHLVWRCPWSNGYRRRKWTWRHEFKSWTRPDCISHSIKYPWERYESNYSPSAMGK